MTATATKTKGSKSTEAIEPAPKYAPGTVEHQALEKVAAVTVAPGPLPPLGGSPEVSPRSRADLVARACTAREHSGRRSAFVADIPYDHSELGELIRREMEAVVVRFGRDAVGDGYGEWETVAGLTPDRPGNFPVEVQVVVAELATIERRLGFIYGELPQPVRHHFPRPRGLLGQRLHDRRRELIAALDREYGKSHSSAGASVVAEILSHAQPGVSRVAHAIDGWVKVAIAIRNGAEFPAGFVEAWNRVLPSACEKFDQWPELAPFVLRVG